MTNEGHQGIEKTRRRARNSVYWAGMNRDIEEMVKRCSECQTLLPVNHKEPLRQPALPTRPWDKLGVDLYSLNNREYLIVTDYFSSFTEFYDLGKDATAPAFNSRNCSLDLVNLLMSCRTVVHNLHLKPLQRSCKIGILPTLYLLLLTLNPMARPKLP